MPLPSYDRPIFEDDDRPVTDHWFETHYKVLLREHKAALKTEAQLLDYRLEQRAAMGQAKESHPVPVVYLVYASLVLSAVSLAISVFAVAFLR